MDKAADHFSNAPARLDEPGRRDVWQAMKHGFFGRCPHCGSGKLFKSFLRPVDHCAACGEDMTHQRADDLPAYLVVLIMGHVAVGGYMMVDQVTTLSVWAHLALWVPASLLAAGIMIQPIKGAVIGLQWAQRMHGFDGSDDAPEGTS